MTVRFPSVAGPPERLGLEPMRLELLAWERALPAERGWPQDRAPPPPIAPVPGALRTRCRHHVNERCAQQENHRDTPARHSPRERRRVQNAINALVRPAMPRH